MDEKKLAEAARVRDETIAENARIYRMMCETPGSAFPADRAQEFGERLFDRAWSHWRADRFTVNAFNAKRDCIAVLQDMGLVSTTEAPE